MTTKKSKWIDGKVGSSANGSKAYGWGSAEKKPKTENKIRLTLNEIFVDGAPINIPPESRIQVSLKLEIDGQPLMFSFGKNMKYDISVTAQDFDVC